MSARRCIGVAGPRAALAPGLPTSSHEPASEPDSEAAPLTPWAAPLRCGTFAPLESLVSTIEGAAERLVPEAGGPVQGGLQTC